MDVADLIVRAGYEGAELSRGLDKSAREVTDFGRVFYDLYGKTRTLKLPDLDTQTTITQLGRLGVTLADLKTGFAELGLSFDQTAQRFRNSTGRFVSQIDALSSAAGVIERLAAEAKAAALNDEAIRSQVRILAEGARITATQEASLKGLRTIYAQLSRELSAGNIPLERRIQLERELVRIRTEFVRVSAASRVAQLGDLGNSFASSATDVARTTRNLAAAGTEASRTASRFRLLNDATGTFSPLGRKFSGAAIGIAFALEGLAREGATADDVVRKLLRTVASVSAFFGVKGLLVAGVAAATAAMIDLFTQTREEMQKTQEAFKDSLTDMVRSADVVGILKALQEVQIGKLTLDPKSGVFKLTGGLSDLKAELADLEAKQLKAFQSGDVLAGIGRYAGRIRELRAEIPPLQEQYDLLTKTLSNFPKVPKLPELPKPITVTGKGPATLDEQVKGLKEQVDLAIASASQLSADFLAQERIAAQLVQLHAQARTLLAGQSDELSEASVTLRGILDTMREVGILQAALRRQKFEVIPTVDPVEIRSLIDRVVLSAPKTLEIPIAVRPSVKSYDLSGFEVAVKRLKEAEQLLDFSKLTGDASFQAEAGRRLDAAKKRVEDYANTIRLVMTAANVPAAVQRQILADILALLKGIEASAPATAELAQNIRLVTTAARGLLTTAHNVGFIGDQAEAALSSLLQLADGIAALQAPGALAKFAGILGVIGGIGQLLESLNLIGESPAEKERQRVMRANNEELARLRVELSGFTRSVGQQIALAARVEQLLPALDRVAHARPDVDLFGRVDFGPVQRAFQVLIDEMTRLGLNMQELAVIAKQAGFDILDSQGRVVPDAVRQWVESIQLAAQAAFKFSGTLDDRRTQIELLNRARGIPESADQMVADSIKLFRDLAPKLYEQFFAGIDLNDPNAQRAAIERFLSSWFAQTIDPALFDGFENKDEVVSLISSWLDGIDRMTEAANEAAKALTNVPAGFKIERARFAALLADDRLLLPTLPPKTKSTIAPTSTVVYQFTFQPGSIVANQDARVLFDTIKTEGQRRVRSLGPTVKVAEVFEQ